MATKPKPPAPKQPEANKPDAAAPDATEPAPDAAAPDATEPAPGAPGDVRLLVAARRDGFRRCGIAFGRAPIEVTVSQAQAETLALEPMLSVVPAGDE